MLTSNTIGCEKVDLLIIDEIRGSLTPMCQYVNPRGTMFDSMNLVDSSSTSSKHLNRLLAPHTMSINSGSAWTELLGRGGLGERLRIPYVVEKSGGGADSLKNGLGDYYEQVLQHLPKECGEIKNYMAIPVRCTRGVSHNVAVMLCMNKMVDVQGER